MAFIGGSSTICESSRRLPAQKYERLEQHQATEQLKAGC
jgi:hypothetical protein